MGNPKASLASFFNSISNRIIKKNGSGFECFQVEIAGKVIEIRYWDEQEIAFIKQSLLGRLRVIDIGTTPDAVIWCYTDDVNIYIPDILRNRPLAEGAVTDVYQGKDETGRIKVTRDAEMAGADYSTNSYYFCRQSGINYDDSSLGHPLLRCFYFWAEQEKLLILHSAAVGINNKGVLISARGGAGKSTLSVTCLLEGLDFVSDDYVIMPEQDEPLALPLYTMVGLNQDMYEILKPTMPVIKTEKKRNNKKFFDASHYPFQEQLLIKAIIFPSVSKADEIPTFTRIQQGPVLVKLVHSSVNQIGGRRNIEMVRKMLDRLKDLPVYEFSLSKDLKKNAAMLKEFVEGL